MSRREIVDLQLNNRFRSTSTLCAMDAMVARIKEKHYIAAMWLTKSCYGGELSQPLGRFEVNLSRIGRANEVRPEDAAVDDAVLVDYFDVLVALADWQPILTLLTLALFSKQVMYRIRALPRNTSREL